MRSDTSSSARNGALYAGLLVAAGTVLLLSRLGAQSLWIDEGLTVTPVLRAHSLRELASLVQSFDTQPPGSHALLYALHKFLPASEFFLRLPSLIAIEAALLVLYALVRRLWDSSTALAFLAAGQLSPLLAFYAMEARNYGLWLLVAAVSWYTFVLFLEACADPDRRRSRLPWAILLGIVNAAGLWVHLFHLFVPAAQVVVATICLLRSDREERSGSMPALLSLSLVTTAILFLPWALRLIEEFRTGQAGVPWTRDFTIMNVPYYLFAAHFGMSFGPNLLDLHIKPLSTLVREHPLPILLGGVAVSATVAAYARLLRNGRREGRHPWEWLVLVVAPVVLAGPAIVYGAVFRFPLHIRHLIIVWPLLPLTLALAFARLPWGRTYYATVMALQAYALAGLLFNGYYWKDDARGAVQFAERHSAGPSYVLGDVAAYYVKQARGATRSIRRIEPPVQDVWILDNRAWEPQNRRDGVRLAEMLASLGLQQVARYDQFHGIDLIHWEKPR